MQKISTRIPAQPVAPSGKRVWPANAVCAIGAVVLLGMSMPAAAQPATNNAAPATASDCTANPQANKPGETARNNQSLTQKLDGCNGVLQPPRTGDTDMVEPAPDTGQTPVIRPPMQGNTGR